jgi:polysaccharide pyruvyl transferase WcaK-like protein
VATIATWKDLVASLLDVDVLIASRLHSAILGVVSQTPTVAISFDPKVDRMMEDLGHTAYLLKIRDFTAEDVIGAVDSMLRRKDVVLRQIASYLYRIAPMSALQYDALAELALAGSQHVIESPERGPSRARAVEETRCVVHE